MEVCEHELVNNPIPIPAPVYSELLIMDWRENSRTQWNRNDPEQVAKARARFDELRNEGYLAYKLNASATQGEVLGTFDPEARTTVLHANMVGG